MRQLVEKSGASVLSVKRDLVDYKRKGLIFYIGSIVAHEVDDAFELYFAYKATATNSKRAFPVSEQTFRRYVNAPEQIGYLRQSFERYFEIDSMEYTDDYFVGMSMFLGERFSWYYCE